MISGQGGGHFCCLTSSPVHTIALMSEEFQFQENVNSKEYLSIHSGQKLFRGCAGEEVRGGKTDAGMKQQVRGNWISSMLHTTRSHSRLGAAHAKDALTVAKSLSSKDRPLSTTHLCVRPSVIL